MKTKILMLKNRDEKKEIEFELNYLLSLTTKQRFKKLFMLSDFLKNLTMKHGYYRKTNRRIS